MSSDIFDMAGKDDISELVRLRTAYFLCITLCVFILIGCGKTEPEYRYEDFTVRKIENDYVYVIPETTTSDSEEIGQYAIERDFFKGLNFGEGSKISISYKSWDKGDMYGIDVHSVSIMAEPRALPSRSDFENLDKDLSVDQIIKQFGNCGYEGSGIIYHVWKLDDG